MSKLNTPNRISIQIREAWRKTTPSNWDRLNALLNKAEKMIKDGRFSEDLIATYTTTRNALDQQLVIWGIREKEGR